MPVTTYNEKSLADGRVPVTGSTSGAGPSGPGASAKGQRNVIQAAGTANLRADGTTKEASPRTAPGGTSHIPKSVDKYTDAQV